MDHRRVSRYPGTWSPGRGGTDHEHSSNARSPPTSRPDIRPRSGPRSSPIARRWRDLSPRLDRTPRRSDVDASGRLLPTTPEETEARWQRFLAMVKEWKTWPDDDPPGHSRGGAAVPRRKPPPMRLRGPSSARRTGRAMREWLVLEGQRPLERCRGRPSQAEDRPGPGPILRREDRQGGRHPGDRGLRGLSRTPAVGAAASLARLDRVRDHFFFAPITTAVMESAASLWADARRLGRPTADRHALDADVILAAQALSLSGPGDRVIVATTNARHLERFVKARDWATWARRGGDRPSAPRRAGCPRGAGRRAHRKTVADPPKAGHREPPVERSRPPSTRQDLVSVKSRSRLLTSSNNSFRKSFSAFDEIQEDLIVQPFLRNAGLRCLEPEPQIGRLASTNG